MRTFLMSLLVSCTACERTPKPPDTQPPAATPQPVAKSQPEEAKWGSPCAADSDCVRVISSGCSCQECDVVCKRKEYRGTCDKGRCTELLEVHRPEQQGVASPRR